MSFKTAKPAPRRGPAAEGLSSGQDDASANTPSASNAQDSIVGELTVSNRLPVLAAEIRRAHADVQEAAKTAAERAIAAGHALIEAKALVKHGEWLPFLREHCALAERTAQLYMSLARSGHSAELVSQLGLKAAEKALALQYCFHRPLFDGDESLQREWRLFALFLIRLMGVHPHGVEYHIDWIGRKGFTTVEGWLTKGMRLMRSWRSISDDARKAEETKDKQRLAAWHSFQSEHANLTIDQLDADLEKEGKSAPELKLAKTRLRHRNVKSATVADLGAVAGKGREAAP